MDERAEPKEVRRDPLDLLLNRRSPPRASPLEGGGLSPLDLLELPPDLQAAMNQVIRLDHATAAQVAESIQVDVAKASALLDTLVARGHLKQAGEGRECVYKPILGKSRRPRLSSRLWEMLQEED